MELIDRRKKMLETSIPKLILFLSIPTVLSQLTTVIYNAVDTYYVSKISTEASAAVGIVYSLQSIIQAVGYGFAMGGGTLVSLRLGQKKSDDANKYASTAFFSSIIFGLIILILGLLFLKPLMFLLGATSETITDSMCYAKYMLISAPIFCGQFVLNNIIRSEGESTYAMIGITVGGILNIILDPIFIFNMDLGIEGAAIATSISQFISFLILLYIALKKSIVKINHKYVSNNINDYTLIITTGIPTVFRQGMGSVSTALLNNQAKIYGPPAVAAISIVNKVYMLIRNIVLGVGQGFQPVAGFNYGAGQKKRVKKAFNFTSLIGTITCLLFALTVFIFRTEIITIFRNDPEVVRIGEIGLIFYSLSIPILGFSTYINQMYQCLGFKVRATFLAVCRQGIFYIPLILILPIYYGLNGILAVQSIADILTCLISIPFLIYFNKTYLNENKTE